jgi:release factor glutamine methyltransferase
MLTVLEAIKLSTEYLEKKGIESPRTNAELLLASVLKCKRLELYLSYDRPLKEPEKDKYRELIARRGKFEPLQYITGWVEFFGLRFDVDSSVLIPRPETEILIETIVNENKGESGFKILDIGTGSGNIAIALAKFMQNAEVTSIDISEEAIELAKKNAELNEVDDKVNFLKLDAFDDEALKKFPGFDILVSNPPYVSKEEYQDLQKEIVAHEPIEAVTDNADGYKFYDRICYIGKELLKHDGKLYFELGHQHAQKVREIIEAYNYINVRIVKDCSQIERVIYGEKQ